MNVSTLKTKMLEEIDLVPEDKLPQLYDVIHYFRVGLESSRTRVSPQQQLSTFFQQSPLVGLDVDLRRDSSPKLRPQ